jgi:hypothetical protein
VDESGPGRARLFDVDVDAQRDGIDACGVCLLTGSVGSWWGQQSDATAMLVESDELIPRV